MSTKPNQSGGYKRVPSFLKKMRESGNLTQRQLAAKVKRPQWWVARIETGSRRIDVAEFIIFCEGCGQNPETAIQVLRRT